MYLILVFKFFRSTFIQWTWLPFPQNKLRRFLPYRSCNSYWISCKWSLLLALKAAIRRGLQLTDWTILIFFLRLSLPLQNLALFWHTVRLSCVHFSKTQEREPMHSCTSSFDGTIPHARSFHVDSHGRTQVTYQVPRVRVLFPPTLLTHGLRDNVLGEAGSELRLWHLVRTEQANWLRVLLTWFTCKAGFARLLKSVKVQVLLWRTQKLRLRFCWNTWRHEGSPKFKAEETGREICSSVLKVNGLDITGWVL